jgi:hypothetical protein
MTTREEAFSAIDSERDYQYLRWGAGGCEHSICEFLVYMKDYIEEAIHVCARECDASANPRALDIVRKVSALGVACMERHGAPRRDDNVR